MTSNLGPFIVGVVAVVWGIALIVFRRPLTTFILKRQSATFGRLADPIVTRGRPWNLGLAGVGAIVLGLLIVALSLFVPHVR